MPISKRSVMPGFDQEVFKGFTFAGEFIGDFDLDVDDAISLFPGSIEIVDQPGDGSRSIRRIDLSNIPERENDNTFDLALGVRIAATEQFSLLSSILVPLNQGGLKSTVTATVGVSIFFNPHREDDRGVALQGGEGGTLSDRNRLLLSKINDFRYRGSFLSI